MDVYRITDWDLFVIAQARRLKGEPAWFACPTMLHEARWYPRLVARDDGLAVLGVLMMLVGLAARQRLEGLLADRMGPFDATDIAFRLRLPPAVVENALAVLQLPELNRVELVEYKAALSLLGARSEYRQSTLAIETDRQTDRSVRYERNDVQDDQEYFGQAQAILTRLLAVKRLKPRTAADGQLLGKVAIALARGILSEHIVWDAVGGVENTELVEKPYGLLIDLLQKGCTAAGVSFRSVTAIEIPADWKARSA